MMSVAPARKKNRRSNRSSPHAANGTVMSPATPPIAAIWPMTSGAACNSVARNFGISK
jgi:hypothetical protein